MMFSIWKKIHFHPIHIYIDEISVFMQKSANFIEQFINLNATCIPLERNKPEFTMPKNISLL